jgi:cyclopropane fatty-acyl-phospholipid synthase-like methyltransferase
MSASNSAHDTPSKATTDPAERPQEGQRYDPDYAYGKYDEKYYEKLVVNEKRRSHKWRLRWVQQCLAPKVGDRIVDLGCGAGAVSHYIAEKGAEVHGVDLSEKAIEAAKVVNAKYPLASFRVCDASRCTHLADASFDKACSVDVIEHCGYDIMLDIFAEAYRLLKPGGLYYVYTPNPKHWIERLKDRGILKQDETHTGLRPAEPIIEGLELKGFEIVKHLKPVSMVPIVNWFEKLWSLQPILRQLAIYRIAVLARKPV